MFPPFQHDRQDTHEDLSGGIGVCLPDSSSLAYRGMVPSVAEDVGGEASLGTGSPPRPTVKPPPSGSGGSHVSDSMAGLRQTYVSQEFSSRVTKLLLQSWRANTHSSYNLAWTKWCGWCAQRPIYPFSASLSDIMEFLADQYDLGLQYRSINTLRSALSTTHPQVDEVNVGSHPLVQRLLKGIFNSRPPAPSYNGAWDVSTVVEYLRSCCTDELSILDLGRKVVTLMALANEDRCSDLAALDRDYLRWTPSGVQFTVVRLTKT